MGQITTKKKSNLILNVDGCIALCFVDLLRHSGFFTEDEADGRELLEMSSQEECLKQKRKRKEKNGGMLQYTYTF